MKTETKLELATSLNRLAGAVLLFHRGGPWTERDRATWRSLTGEDEATTKVLCDLARRTIERAGTWRERQAAEVARSGGSS
jgi:predicted NUDIX family NTP pyrophosphohydrolase